MNVWVNSMNLKCLHCNNQVLSLLLWQSPRGNRVVTHWASMLRWIWSISEYNLTTRDSRKRTPMGGSFVRKRRGSVPEKQQPKHNPCRPVGVWQRSVWSVGIHMVSQHNQWKIWSGIVHHKSWPQNMCLTHSWLQHHISMKSIRQLRWVHFMRQTQHLLPLDV